MGCRTVGEFAGEFKEMLSPEALDAMGREAGLCERVREIAPRRLAARPAGELRVRTGGDAGGPAAGFQRAAREGGELQGVPQAVVEAGVRGLHARAVRLDRRAVGDSDAARHGGSRGIRPRGDPGRHSFAVEDALRERFPGRFKTVSPAAELHATMELPEGTASRTALTADAGAERPHLPDAASLRDALLLADRGCFDVDYLAAVDRAGKSINPTVLRATANGRELADLRERPLKQCDLPKTGAVDLDVDWRRGATTLRARLVARWNPKDGACVLLVTNLPRGASPPSRSARSAGCAGKWNCCSRSGSRTPTCAPSTPPTRTSPRGWSGPTLAAAALKRHVAHATQVLRRVEISTRKVAMCARHGLVRRVAGPRLREKPSPAVRSPQPHRLPGPQRLAVPSETRSPKRPSAVRPGTRPLDCLSTYL